MSDAPSAMLHATTVAIDGRAVLLTGPSGSGKSDLALRLISGGAVLVSDDYTVVTRDGTSLIATPPDPISGKIEVRGIGIVDFDYCRSAPVALILDLSAPVERLPQACESKEIAGISIPMCPIAPFEGSAPAKVALALKAFGLATGANGGAAKS